MQENTTAAPFLPFPVTPSETKRETKSRPYCYPPVCKCGAKKDRRSQLCKECQYVLDKTLRRDVDLNVYFVSFRPDFIELCRKIPLTKGQYALVSVLDYPEMGKRNWLAIWNVKTQSFYARRGVKSGSRTYGLMLHTAVFENAYGTLSRGKIADHVSKISLDCRRSNLREATHAENMYNSGKRRNNTSGYKGVTWNKQKGKWMAQIRAHGKHRCLGLFSDPAEAYAVYCEAAKAFHGEFARVD